MTVGHGDYAPRNAFIGGDGRIAVFDPMTRWLVPCYEDLCRFLIGIRLLGLQVHTHGAAYGRDELERREQEVIRGYFAEEQVPSAELRCYQLLILFDKWSALVEVSNRRWPTHVRTAAVDFATHYLRVQAQRLLDLATSSQG
jgi:aminoglycoside phosphotransferase (APT) family kinase protein